MVFVIPLATLVSLSALSGSAYAAMIQKPLLRLPASAVENRQIVKDMFIHSYDVYKFVLPCHSTIAEILMSLQEARMGS